MRKEKKYCEYCNKETIFVQEGWGRAYGYGLKCSECQRPESKRSHSYIKAKGAINSLRSRA